jgi:hypothetical protein
VQKLWAKVGFLRNMIDRANILIDDREAVIQLEVLKKNQGKFRQKAIVS